jgi:DNA-binding transcriptional MocR family regulator
METMSPHPVEPTGTSAPTTGPLYLQIALQMAQMVASGALKPGQRLPSVRDSAVQNGVSVSTVVQAFRYLEEHGLVQPRPKAGYFVANASKALANTLVRKMGPQSAAPADPAHTHAHAHAAITTKLVASFAGYSPKDKDFFDTDRIRVALSRATRLKRNTLIEYSNSSGTTALRDAVALRALHLGCALRGEDIVITAGCIHAISLCLQAVTQPGDLVAVESPTFFGFLDLLEAMNLKALAIPSDPRTGVSLPALQLALQTQPIRAIVLVPTLSNPQGSVMPLTHKRALAQLVAQHQVPLIEDVVFNDLLATDARRKAVKAFDTQGWVMTCGSFAKTVAPGIRLGWTDAGRWSQAVATLKRVQGATTNAVLEYALADLLTQGNYEAQLRRLCLQMKQRLGQARRLIQASFPKGTRVYDPPAGYTLWVELPEHQDAMTLFARCKALGIQIGPGQLFCSSPQYQHFIRLSFAGAWGGTEQEALSEVGRLACTLPAGDAAPPVSAPNPIDRTNLMCGERVSVHDLW